jgi:VWFA-related protein
VRNAVRIAVSAVLLAAVALAQNRPATPTYQQDKPAAKEPPKDQVGGLRFIDATEVTVVNVDVSVTDKDGPVLGLTSDDFEVYQDRKLQELTNFYFFTPEPTAPPVSAAAPAPTAAATQAETPPEPEAAPPREPRFVALYIDNENILPLDRNRVLDTIKEFVRDYLHPPDQMMVAAYQRSFKVLQHFTSDSESVVSALRDVSMYTGGLSSVESDRSSIEDDIRDSAERGGGDPSRELQRVRGFAREQRNNLIFTIRSLQEMVTTMRGLPGKKAIIYLSDGLPMTPGLELYYELQDQFKIPTITSDSMEFQSTDLFRGLVTSAAAAGVTLYAIDARGLQSSLGIEAERRAPRSTLSAGVLQSNYQDSLLYMADETGGSAIINTNNVRPGLDKIGRELSSYYSLGYRLVPSGSDRMHSIQVKVKGHPEYRLNYQKMFIEKTLPSRVADRVISGLAYDLEDNPLGIKLEAGEPAPGTGGFWLLPVQIKGPIGKIALVPDGEEFVGYIMAYYAARDDEGKQSDLQRTEHVIRVARADYDKASDQLFTVDARLLLEPGTYKISVGVRDELTNQAGYAAVRRTVHPEQK